jgi:hypothetical protein
VREGDHLEDPGMDRRIILKLIFKRLVGGHGLDRSASGKRRWQAVVNAVINLQVSQNSGIS